MQAVVTSYGIPLEGPVSSDSLESVLAESWQQATISDSQPPTRASVLSLIVSVVHPWSAERAIDVVGRLLEQHPSRTLVLVPELELASDDLHAWYKTSCAETDSTDQQLCGEQIVISARGQASLHLAPLADQLILPDLPAFLWWAGDLFFAVEPLFDRLAGLADRIIVDSASFRNLGPATVRLRRIARRHQSGSLTDLSWARLTPWREFISQFFDAPALRSKLATLDNVAIEYAPSGSDGPAQALLLLGWLGTSLGWTPDPDTVPVEWPAHGRFRRPDGRFVEFTAEPSAANGLDGLRQVVLQAGSAARFRVERNEDGAHALTEATVDGGPTLQRTARFESSDLSTLLASELMLFGRDHVYESALAVAVTLVGGAGQPSSGR